MTHVPFLSIYCVPPIIPFYHVDLHTHTVQYTCTQQYKQTQETVEQRERFNIGWLNKC
jgi:hypothetical protein